MHLGTGAEGPRTTTTADEAAGAGQLAERQRLGELIRDARERAGLSKRAAARRAGISEGRWRQLEDGYEQAHGRRTPANATRATLVRMAQAISLPPAELLRAAGFAPDSAAEVVDVTGLRPDEVARVREFVRFLRYERAALQR